MKVILLEDDTKLGDKGSVVDVAKGFAQNFLIPFKKAVIATKGNISVMTNALNMTKKKIAKEQKSHQDLADKLSGLSLDFTHKAGATGHLYGTITTEQIVEYIKEKSGVEISKKKVVLSTHIKMAGTYSAKIKLYSGVDVTLPVVVTAVSDEEIGSREGRPTIRTARHATKF